MKLKHILLVCVLMCSVGVVSAANETTLVKPTWDVGVMNSIYKSVEAPSTWTISFVFLVFVIALFFALPALGIKGIGHKVSGNAQGYNESVNGQLSLVVLTVVMIFALSIIWILITEFMV